MNLRTKLTVIVVALGSASVAQADPIVDFFTGNYRIYTGIVNLAPQNNFVARQNFLGLDVGVIDFETLPDGSPTQGNTDSGRFPSDQYPVRYDSGYPTAVNFSSMNNETADLYLPSDGSTGASAIHVSPFYALAATPDNTAEILVEFADPVSAAGIWLTDVDDFLSGPDARVTWYFEDGSSLSRTSDTAGRVVNQFFGMVAYEDESRTTAFNSIVRMSFRELGGNRNQADNLVFGLLPAGTPVPEPSTLALLGIGLFGLGLSRRRKHLA